MSRNVATMKDDIVVNKSTLIEQYLPPKAPTPSTTSPSPSASNSQSSGQTNKLNRKQMLLQHNLELRKKFEKMVLEWQELLCDPVSVETLGEAVSNTSPWSFGFCVHRTNTTEMRAC